MFVLSICIVGVIAAAVVYLRQIHSSFSKYGVKYITPVPLVGNTARLHLRLDHFADNIRNLYNKFPEERFVGRFEFTKESVMIRDLDLIKQVTSTDFHCFNHRSIFSESNSFFASNLFALNGPEWKKMRAKLSPAFTSSKMRKMVPCITEVGQQMMEMMKRKVNESKTDYIDVDCADLTACYANDVITSFVYGLKVDSYNDPKNLFYVKGSEAATFGFREIFIYFLMNNVPKLTKLMQCDLFPMSCKEFFRNVVVDTMKYREMKQTHGIDMIHMLMKCKNELNEDDIAAQSLLLYLEGFGTVTILMSFLLYELAVNSDAQERLAKEIKEHNKNNGGKLDYDSLNDMTYLGMVISEVIRLWHPSIVLERDSNMDYNLGKPNKNAEKDFIIKKGTTITIPIYAIHRDPKYFPDPDKFTPERFSAENKHKIHPFSYIPFGIGPRNCIGLKLGLYEMKAITYQILLHMEVLPTETTCVPAKLCPRSFSLKLQDGHTLRFRLRT